MTAREYYRRGKQGKISFGKCKIIRVEARKDATPYFPRNKSRG